MRIRRMMLIVLVCVVSFAFSARGAYSREPARERGRSRQSLEKRDTLTDDWFGAGETLGQYGFEVGLGVTNVYQYNLHDGTEPGNGAYSGSYDLEIEGDLDRAFGLRGGTIFMLAEGSRAESTGLDDRSVGSLFGINDDFGGDRSLDITELWYQQDFLDGDLRVRAGKLDLSAGYEFNGVPVAFDGSLYANDEAGQFLNGSLVNNPSIPFPDNGLGVSVFISPLDRWYFAAGAADAKADARTTGFNTVFDGNPRFFGIAETGIVPDIRSAKGRLPAAYRMGIWNTRIPREHLQENRTRRDDVGGYISADQMLWRENKQDLQGLGAFTRLGVASDTVNEVEFFGSLGLSYRGLVPGRGEDVLGLGYAHGDLSTHGGFSASSEQVIEVYYQAQVAPWLRISPDLQLVSDPGGDRSSGDVLAAGVRVQVDF
ncbi:MAG: carbohydrate porin [Candidatus Brocadiia bacterium]